jgi:hypothetical protein
MFIISAFVFFVSMVNALILMANNKMKTVRIFGWILIALMFFIIAILINFIIVGKDLMLIIYCILIISYLMAEFLLDTVFKFDFRSKAITHVPYIILEYAACFSFVFGALAINRTLGWIVSFFFWAFLGTLIYYLVMQRKNKRND